jgi:hypothetical protein
MILDDVVLLADTINRLTAAEDKGVRRATRSILRELSGVLDIDTHWAASKGLEILDGGNAGRPKQ